MERQFSSLITSYPISEAYPADESSNLDTRSPRVCWIDLANAELSTVPSPSLDSVVLPLGQHWPDYIQWLAIPPHMVNRIR
jgi:hypothetical protein